MPRHKFDFTASVDTTPCKILQVRWWNENTKEEMIYLTCVFGFSILEDKRLAKYFDRMGDYATNIAE